MKVIVEDELIDEVLVANPFEDTEDGQVGAKGLDVKTHLLNLDGQYADDVLHCCVH